MNNEADSEFKKKSKFTTLYPEYKTVEKIKIHYFISGV